MIYDEKLNKLKELRAKADEQMVALEHSLHIKEMCSSAFEHGSCKAGWATDEDRNPVFRIRRGDGSTITFPFVDVPEFFKLDHAAKREITAHTPRSSGKLVDPVSKEVHKFLRKRVTRKYRGGVND